MADRASYGDAGTLAHANLIAGDEPAIVAEKRTIKTGAGALVAGTLLGQISADKKLKTSAAAAGDGSEVPHSILAEDVDATAADKEAIVYIQGVFNPLAMTFGAGHTAASVKDALRNAGIFLKNNLPA